MVAVTAGADVLVGEVMETVDAFPDAVPAGRDVVTGSGSAVVAGAAAVASVDGLPSNITSLPAVEQAAARSIAIATTLTWNLMFGLYPGRRRLTGQAATLAV